MTMGFSSSKRSTATPMVHFVALLMTFLVAAEALEAVEDYKARLSGIFQSEFDMQEETFALWVGIADPDYGDMYFVYGNSTGGPPPDMPAMLDEHFDIGSISKTMGGTVIMRMVEEGMLNFEDTIEDLVPELTDMFPEYGNYTVEELLRMKTLVPDFLNDQEGESCCFDAVFRDVFWLTFF